MYRILLLLLCAAFLAFGQANDRTVRDARRALGARDYTTVVNIYEAFVDTVGTGSSVLEFLTPVYIEALSNQREHNKVVSLSASFIAQFPNSQQVVRVYYLWGVAKANLGNFVQAIVALDEGLSRASARERETERAIRNLIQRISNDHLSQQDREIALASGVSSEMTSILQPQAAATTRPADTTPDNRRSRGADEAIGKTIGLLVPMSGEFFELGRSTLNTVRLILDQHEERTGEKFTLKIYDTEGSAVRTAQRVRELLNDRVSMVIGPVMSNTATVAAAVLSHHPSKSVMITPTATDDGIAALGKNIFQINLTPKTLAERIAEYAVEDLNIRNFTILAPLDEYGRLMSNYFSAAVKRKGATVDFTEFFSPSASDHRRQFRAVREHHANLRFSEEISPEKTQFLADSMITLGGLFLPVSQPDNAIQLIAQVPFNRLRAQVLGANVWGNQRVIDEGRGNVQDICFSSPYRIDLEDERVKSFIEAYSARYEQAPNMLVAPLVADAVDLMLRAFAQSNTVSDLARNLSLVSDYRGLSSKISLNNPDGINSSAVIMKISGQRAVRVK